MSTSALSGSSSSSSALMESLSSRRKLTPEQVKTQEQQKASSTLSTLTASSTAATPHSGALNMKALSSASSQSVTQSTASSSTREILASRQMAQDQVATSRMVSGEKAYMQAIKAAQIPSSSSLPQGGSPTGPSAKALKSNAPSINEKYAAGDAKKAPAEPQLYKPSARAGNKALIEKSRGNGAM